MGAWRETVVQDVEQIVFGIIAEKAKIDSSQISRATEMANLKIDSVDTVEAIFEIEEKFDISLAFNANGTAAGRIDTAGDVVDLVYDQLKSRNKS